ncbi:PQQ-binding-like beta-propeller repeat protein [Rhodospira trueperi]|uniref:Outer membrane protein assembly factor BamB, contains PQQ-like beta-propeller repeat n=1 Tax=Rhodospira trueperi TaxID=69960 RepID=A0A1G7DY00_9PROT|nr:PQQ-binding-like beta-propeller repeat protein [Rhodospira trueperi]SDE56261.1 Outer membrane protein assembly factor BamB, contains PQQ-like beta-propeller repeat [Rhodospira trueperi]
MGQAITRWISVLSVGAVTLVLAGCGWWGADTDDPLPGRRISVLEQEVRLSPPVTASPSEVRLPPPAPNDDWPMAGGYANHAMHHMTLADAPERIWRTDIGTGSGSRDALLSEPVIGGGRVYTIDTDAEVRALDLATGDVIWRRELPNSDEEEDDGDLLSGGLAYGEDGRLYATTGFAKVVALDAVTGEEIWREEVDAPIRAAPTLNSGRLFVVTIDNQTVALAAQDGRKLWTHAGSPETASLLGAPAPAVDQGTVIVAYSSGELYALRIETGAVLWQDTVTMVRRTDAAGNLRDIRGRPVMAGSRVYVVGHSGLMTAIDLATGERIWQAELGGIEQPWIAGRFLFVVTAEADLAAVSAETGKVHWVTPLQRWDDPGDKEGPIVWTGPLLASDRLIVPGSNGEILAVSPYDGRILGFVEAPDGVTIPPVLAQDTLLVLTDGGDLVAYR